jgi:ribonuclease I
MSKDSYAEEVAAIRVMLSGARAHLTQLSKRGIDQAFITGFEADLNDMITMNNEQEALKARLKEKTAALDETSETAKKKMSELKKMIKIELPQESWREFGIEDKR